MSPTKGYTEMKDSGIEWVGPIPGHWDILRGKNVLRLLERPVKLDDDVVTCFRDGEVTLRKNRREEGFTNSLKEIGYQGIEPGDLIVHGMDGFAGAIGISDSRGKASPVLNVMDSNQNKRYLMYYLRAMAYKDVFMALSTGIRVRSCDLRWNKLSVFPFLIPKSHEQSAIAAYLDTQCAKIDEIIAQAKASIEDYKQWKASIIYEAVTKGLDPNVEMKDSGIEWIGKMPKHWQDINPKALFSQRKERANPGDRQLTASQQFGVIYQDEYMEMTGTKVVTVEKDFDILKYVSAGDFVISMRSFQGGLEYSTKSGSISSAYVMLVPNLKLVYPRYYRWLLKSNGYIRALQSTSDLVRDGQAMRYSNFAKVRLITLPLGEQEQIANYLDTQCAKIDKLMTEKQSLIDDLESYKKSLIYEVVTGKRRVC